MINILGIFALQKPGCGKETAVQPMGSNQTTLWVFRPLIKHKVPHKRCNQTQSSAQERTPGIVERRDAVDQSVWDEAAAHFQAMLPHIFESISLRKPWKQ